MAKTDAERQQARRDRVRGDGLVELRAWVTPEDRERIRGWLAGEHPLKQKRKPKNRAKKEVKEDTATYYFKIKLNKFMSDKDINKLMNMGFEVNARHGYLFIKKDQLKAEHIEDARHIAMMSDTSFDMVRL